MPCIFNKTIYTLHPISSNIDIYKLYNTPQRKKESLETDIDELIELEKETNL